MYSVTCPHCRQASQWAERPQAEEIRCTYCRKAFRVVFKADASVPAAPASTPPAAVPAASTGSAPIASASIQVKPRASAPVAAPTPAAAVDETPPEARGGGRVNDDDDLPSRRRDRDRRRRDRDFDRPPGSGNAGLIVGLVIGGIVLFGGLTAVLMVVLTADDAAPIAVQNPPPAAFQARPHVLDPTRADHFDFMMAELKSDNEDHRHIAYRWLRQAEPNHPRRGEVTKILEERVALYRAQVFGDDEFFDAYFRWATRDNYPWLSNMARNEEFTVWGNARRHRSMEVLGKLKEERAVEDIARNLESIHHRDPAYRALLVMGPVAEKKLQPLLLDPNAALRHHVARLLGDIGTRESLSALDNAAQKHAQDGQFVEHVKRARQAIEGRAQ